MKRVMVLGVLVVVGGLSLAATGFQAPPAGGGQGRGRGPQGPPVAQIEKVTDNLYEITGGGGNSAAFITEKGVVLVDTKLANWGQAILDKIKTVTDKPVIEIINTHTHGDHTGSNEFFGTTVEIVAQENTRTNMEKMDAFKGDKSVFLPKKTFKDKMSLGSGKDRIDLYYFGRGHTNGDAWIVYPAIRVMQTGDMFAWKDAPTLDRANGGSGLEYAQTVGKALATIKDVDTLIVGHSPLRKPAELQEYQRFMTDFAAAVRAANKAGKSVDDATASIDLSPKYPGYKHDRYKAAIQAIYDELKAVTN